MAYADTGVTVDTCKDGHGAWLDHGEFERIIRALEKEANSMDASDYARASLEEAKELITGNEGLSSEWHDFTHVVRLLEYRVLTEHPRLSNFLTAFYKANPLK
jgi:Zn-finger nucleic acid-binding protein